MKKILFIALLAWCASCVSRGDADRMQQQIDSLQQAVNAKEALFDEVFASINVITENLGQIKSREGIISLQTDEVTDRSTLGRLSDDIAAIDRLLQENRARIAELESKAEQLRRANVRIKGLEKLIEGLNGEIEQKNEEIDRLKEHMSRMGAEVEELTAQVESKTEEVQTLNHEKENLTAEVQARTTELHTGYYLIAPQKDLLRDQVVVKKGFIGRTLVVNEKPNLALFTPADTRMLKTLPIGQKNVTVVTAHPKGSYWLVDSESDKNVVESLVILDEEAFWSLSKILVVSYK